MSNTEARQLIADQLDATNTEIEKAEKRIASLGRSLKKTTARQAELVREADGLAQALETLGGPPGPDETEATP